MAAVNFIGGEKGGVGKSVVARVLAQYFIDRAVPFIGFDTDASHASFKRFYSDFASSTVVDDFANLDRIAESIVAEPQRQVLVDLAAQTMRPLSRWIGESGVIELMAEAQVPIRFWHVMDDGMDSLSMLESLLATYGDKVQYVVVLNHGRGSDFKNFEESEARRLALARGAKVISLPGLHEASMRKIDRQNVSFWAAINHRGSDDALGLLERQRVKIWLSRTYGELEKAVGTAAAGSGSAAAYGRGSNPG